MSQVRERVRTARNHVQDLVTVFKNKAGAGQLSVAIAETAEV